MNALKHAFPSESMKGRINIAYDVEGTNWKLSVADNGVGKPDGVFAQSKTGLGTGIIKALAQQLNATVETLAGPRGTIVSVSYTHLLFGTDYGSAKLSCPAARGVRQHDVRRVRRRHSGQAR